MPLASRSWFTMTSMVRRAAGGSRSKADREMFKQASTAVVAAAGPGEGRGLLRVPLEFTPARGRDGARAASA
jgi:hypothetical protein